MPGHLGTLPASCLCLASLAVAALAIGACAGCNERGCLAEGVSEADDAALLQARTGAPVRRQLGGAASEAERDTAPRQMKLHLMLDKGLDSAVGAVCLDGSPGAFYFSPGVGTSRNDWLIFIEGGGWCTSPWDCYVGRANVTGPTSLGSSKGYVEFGKDWMNKGINSLNCSVSPFCNYTHVYMKYCDGTSFSGNQEEPVILRGTAWQELARMYFRGQRIFDATVDTLLEGPEFGLSSARHVLLSGCSAGGLAATLHADYLHDRLRSAVPTLERYGTAPTSGFFLCHDNVKGEPLYPSQMEQLFALANWTTLNPKCAAAHANRPRNCNFAQYAVQYLDSPLFIINSALDWWQTRCILADTYWQNGGCQLEERYGPCASNITTCTGDHLSAMNGYMDSFMQALEGDGRTTSKPGNGVFINSCHYHCEGAEDEPFATFAVNGVTMRDALHRWWESRHEAGHVHKEQCRYGEGAECNPTCTVFKDIF